ncbi:MAG: hypothetical protein K2J40_01375 [Ruminococcus sp.]|nr:hypothetical protein [Ruminococcus sp.]
MFKQTEKFFRDFEDFMNESNDIPLESEEEINKALESFMSSMQSGDDNADTVYDFLELAELADTKKDALKYAKQAVELEPDNLDALSLVAELTCTSKEKLSDKYEKLIAEAEEALHEQGYFEDDVIGEFWLMFETRPYMRLLQKYADNFVECGQMRLAVAQYEKMLGLCNNDNLGARYSLMHLYAYFEDEQSALELLKKYPEEGTQFLLPLSILYYKLGNLRKANHYLKKLCDLNEDTYKFFELITGKSKELKKVIENMNPYGYRPCTIEELIVETEENEFLFSNTTAYIIWAKQKLNAKKKK